MKTAWQFGTALLLTICALATPAAAEDDHNFFIRTGPAALFLSEGATVKAGGAVVPGGSIAIDRHFTGTLEIGYSFTPNFAVGFTGGYPPTVDINGGGTLSGVGKLGSVTYGPTALTAQYTFTGLGRIQPYVGAGPMFMIVFDNDDGALYNLKVKSAVGAVIQAGIDFNVTDSWGLYADVKKGYLRTKSTGSLGGAPVTADVTLDPLVIGAGVKLRF